MFKVGITGGIGSGKSTVCKVLEVLGVPVFYSDQVGRTLLGETEVKQQVVKAFGEEVLSAGEIDRKRLGGIVFSDKQKLEQLNAIIHPAVRTRFLNWAEEQEDVPFVAQEAAIMIESGGHAFVDHVVCVEAPVPVRTERVMQRDGVGEEAVRTDEQRAEYANTIIINNGVQLVIPQVLKLYRSFA